MVENTIPVQNGKATYRIPSTMAQGIYQINAKYSDDDISNNGSRHYAPSETNNTLTITKNAINGTINENQEIVTKWYEPYTYRATFLQKGVPIVGGTVKFSLGNDKEGNEIVLGTATTNEDGDAFLYNVQLDPNQVPSIDNVAYSTVPLFITLQSSATYNTTPLTTQIKVEKRELDITINTAESISKDEYISVNGYVTDLLDTEEKGRINNLPLQISLESNRIGTVYTTSTVNNVKYTLTDTTKRLPGEYNLHVLFEGNKVYAAKEVSQKIYIKEVYSISTKDYSGLDKETVAIAATIRNSQNKTVSGVKAQCIIYDDDTGQALFTSEVKGSNSKGNLNFEYTPAASSSLTQTMTWTITADKTRETVSTSAKFYHQRKTNITYQSNPSSITYGGEGTWKAYISDSANKAVANAPCNAYITKSGTTTRTQINTNTLKTDKNGVVTFKYKYNTTMEGGHYTITILNEDTQQHQHFLGNSGLGKAVDLKIVNKPVIEVSALTLSESFDSSKATFGTKAGYTNATRKGTFTAYVYRNKKEDGPFPNLSINNMILHYTINGVAQQYDLRGDGVNKTPVTTDAQGKAKLTIDIPCAKFALDNTCKWTINANTDSGEFHTGITVDQPVKVKRHMYMYIPKQSINITSNKNVVTVKAMDSHGDDIDQVSFKISNTQKRGGEIAIAENQASTNNTIAITNYQLPYTTQTIIPGAYYINAWSTNSTNYIDTTNQFFSSAQNDVHICVTPTIKVEINKDYSTNANAWSLPANTDILATEYVAFRLTATYPQYNAGAGVVQKPVPNLQYTYLFEGTDIGGGKTNSSGVHIKTNWEAPETTAYKNKLKAVITSTDNYVIDENPQSILKIKKRILYYSSIANPAMSPRGKLLLKGQFVTLNGQKAAGVKYTVKLSNSNNTKGNTIYDENGDPVTVEANSNGFINYTWDNTTNNPYAFSNLTKYNGKMVYFHFVAQDNSNTEEPDIHIKGITTIYGGVPVKIGDKYKIEAHIEDCTPTNVFYTIRAIDHLGNPLQNKTIKIYVTNTVSQIIDTYSAKTNAEGYITHKLPNTTYTVQRYYLRIVSDEETVGGQVYPELGYALPSSNEGYIDQISFWVRKMEYAYQLQSTTVETTQFGTTKLEAVVYTDSSKQTVLANTNGFKIVDGYTGVTLPGTYSTDSNGLLSATITTNQNAKWYTWKYKFVHPSSTDEAYTESALITVKNKHAITGEATPITCTYNETSSSPLIIRLADKSYTRGTQAGIQGTYSYEDNGVAKTDTYNMTNMGYTLFIDSKNKGNEADFVTMLGGATLRLQSDGILGATTQRAWKNIDLSTVGTYNLVLKPVLSTWTTDQKDKYVQSNITLKNVITIQ